MSFKTRNIWEMLALMVASAVAFDGYNEVAVKTPAPFGEEQSFFMFQTGVPRAGADLSVIYFACA